MAALAFSKTRSLHRQKPLLAPPRALEGPYHIYIHRNPNRKYLIPPLMADTFGGFEPEASGLAPAITPMGFPPHAVPQQHYNRGLLPSAMIRSHPSAALVPQELGALPYMGGSSTVTNMHMKHHSGLPVWAEQQAYGSEIDVLEAGTFHPARFGKFQQPFMYGGPFQQKQLEQQWMHESLRTVWKRPLERLGFKYQQPFVEAPTMTGLSPEAPTQLSAGYGMYQSTSPSFMGSPIPVA